MKEVSVTAVKVASHLTFATFLKPATTWQQKNCAILERFLYLGILRAAQALVCIPDLQGNGYIATSLDQLNCHPISA